MRSVLCVSVVSLCFGISAPSTTSAGILYVQAGVQGTVYSDYWNQGVNAATASGADPGHGSEASASVNLFGADHGLHLYTAGIQGVNEQVAAAQWRDIIRIGGPGPHPSTIRAVIDVSGTLVMQAAPGQLLGAAVYIGMPVRSFDLIPNAPGSFLFGPPSNDASGFNAAYNRPDIGLEFSPMNMNDLSFIAGDVPGTYSLRWKAIFDLSYSDLHGGYIFNVFGSIRTVGRGGSVVTDFGNTFRLVGLTQADGGPLVGDVTFDSGFSLHAVPEPSSIVMLSIGTIALLGYRRSWRRADRAA